MIQNFCAPSIYIDNKTGHQLKLEHFYVVTDTNYDQGLALADFLIMESLYIFANCEDSL